jgi:hypothetical protein
MPAPYSYDLRQKAIATERPALIATIAAILVKRFFIVITSKVIGK